MPHRPPARAVSPVLVALVLAASAALLASPPAAEAQQTTPCGSGGAGSYAEVSRPPRYDILPQEVVTIPSDLDGVDIQMSIVRPDVPDGMRVPVVVEASVYYHPLQTIDARACMARLTENLVPQGYAVVLLAVRGTADSGGCMDLFGPDERHDIDQAITWLGTRSWSTGAVGMYGKSYDGATQWMAAASGNPHLKTIVPASGVPDVFDLLFGGGTPDWRGPTGVITNVYYLESAAFYLPGRSTESTVEVLACPDYVDGNLATAYSGLTGELDPLEYWAKRRYTDEIVANYRGSVLLVQGLQDWNVSPGQQHPLIDDLIAASDAEGRPVRVEYVLGQWGHSHPDVTRDDWADVLLAWFDHELKGDRSADLGPVAEIQDNTGLWRGADSWPPVGEQRTWAFSADGSLAETSAADGSQTVALDPFRQQTANSDPSLPEEARALCDGVACARFATDPVAEELRISGIPQVRLTATPTGPGGQLSVHLYAEGEGGTERIGWGQVDLRFPTGVQPGTPQAREVTPGEPVELDFPLEPLDAVVPAGARLVAVISQGTPHNRMPGLLGAPIELHLGDTTALQVTEVEPAATDFFTPPER